MTSILQNVSGQTNSTVADLSKFNMKVANEHYKVKKEDSLEAILLAELENVTDMTDISV